MFIVISIFSPCKSKMIYIMSAFEAEARSLIDYFKAQKHKSSPFKIFCNKNVLIIISGMGQENAYSAIEYLLLNYPNKEEDIFINLGVCAGHNRYNIGNLVQIKHLKNDEESHILYTIGNSIKEVSCFSARKPLERPCSTDIAEMEAMSIYKGISEYFRPQRTSFLKIVSDNFKPVKPKKQFIIELTRKNLPLIHNHIKELSIDK